MSITADDDLYLYPNWRVTHQQSGNTYPNANIPTNAIHGGELHDSSNLSMNVGQGQESYPLSDQRSLSHLSWTTGLPTVNTANVQNTTPAIFNYGDNVPESDQLNLGLPMTDNNLLMATGYAASDWPIIGDMNIVPFPMAPVVPPQAFFPAPNFTISIAFPPPRHACPWHLGCSESFVRVSDLTRHYNSVHLGIRHHCYWVGCRNNKGKGYCRLEKLRAHQRQDHGVVLV